jgi:hypothetical protein
MCGGTGNQAKSCPACVPRYTLCESLGAPAAHKLGGAVSVSPKTKRTSWIQEPAAHRKQGGSARDLPQEEKRIKFGLADGSRVSGIGGFVTKKRFPSATRHIEERDAFNSGGSRSLKADPGWILTSLSNLIGGGRPYRMVMKKQRPKDPPLMTDMDAALLEEVIGTLFPPQEDGLGQPRSAPIWTVEW